MKFISAAGAYILKPDITDYYSTKDDFFSLFVDDDAHIISVKALKEYIINHSANLCILNTELSKNQFTDDEKVIYGIKIVKQIGEYEIYHINYQN